MAFQFPERSFFATTVRQELEFTSRRLGRETAEEDAHCSLRRVGLSERYLERSPFTLSGGEKRRVALAAAIAHRPQLLLLDEPEVGLDAGGRAFVASLIREHKEEGGAALVATHDLETAFRWADRLIVIDSGRVQVEISFAELAKGERIGEVGAYLADGGAAARLQEAGRALGVELPSPYGEPLEYLRVIQRAIGGDRDARPACAGGP